MSSRLKQLQSVLVVAQQFHEAMEPLSDWLSAAEKRLANSEPMGTQTSKLQEQIGQHKVAASLSPCSAQAPPSLHSLSLVPSVWSVSLCIIIIIW